MVREPPTTENINQMEEEAQQESSQQWNPFESFMIQKLDAILYLLQEHQVEVHSSLENITTRLENI